MEKLFSEKISVLLATYNGSRFVRAQLDSILSQTYNNYELLICDDCSTDDTFSILEEYAQKDNRIKIFQNDHNLGFKKNFERLLSFASCGLIALSDQDDIWTSNHLELLMKNLGENYLICGNAYLADRDGKSTGITLLDCSKFDFLPETQEDWFFYLLHGSVYQGAACLFRKELITNLLPIPDTVKYHDYWLAIHAAMQGGVKYVENPILYYRQHGDNVTTNKRWSFIEKLKQTFNKNYKHQELKYKILFLTALSEKFSDDKRKLLIDAACKYYKRENDISRILNIQYFFDNYKLMYLSNNKRLFLLRFIKKFIFWR